MVAGRVTAAVLVILAAVGLVMNQTRKSENEAARGEGFIDARDKSKARSRGFSDPATWKKTLAAEAEAEKTQAAARVVSKPMVELTGWLKDGFGTVGIVNLKIVNTSARGWISDVLVRCEFFGGSGTRIGARDVTVFETIEPSKSIRKKLNVGFVDQQANRAACRFVDAKVPAGMILEN